MLYLVKNGNTLTETRSDTFLEIIEHLQDFAQVDCDWYEGEKDITKFCRLYSIKGNSEDEILESFGLKKADFTDGVVFEINCYESIKDFSGPEALIRNARAFAFSKEISTQDYKKALYPFFGDNLVIEGTEEI